MKYGSVCSGVEAATLAWQSLGWQAQWFCEFDKFPSAVLSHHWPNIPNLGDMTKISERDEFNDRSINLLVGGTPCQSFSVAGLRKGLDDERGNLALEFCRILIRKKPRWFVWENVPGVLSSNGGSDFANILRGFQECGYGFAYRILDAQYFGVPQRRRRVFVVGYLGDTRPAAAVLFDTESLRRNTPPGRETRQETSTYTESSFGGFSKTQQSGTIRASGGFLGGGSETLHLASGKQAVGTLNASQGDKQFIGNQEAFSGDFHIAHVNSQADVYAFTQNDAARDASHNIAPTLRAGSNGGTVNQAVAYGIQGNIIGRSDHAGGNGTGVSKEVSGTLTTGDKHGVCYTGKIIESKVRRLTPLECERLQGFPDNHTQIPWRNKAQENCPDGPRYKACGNSMAVPVMKWIGERIQQVDDMIKR